MSGAPWSGRGIRAGVRRLFRLPISTQDRASDDADAELDALLEARIEHLVARGMTPVEAQAEAIRRLGAPLNQVRANLRRSAGRREGRRRLMDGVDALREDVRFALRQAARGPGFTAIVVLTLALGIGVNTAIFSVVHRLLLAPLPFPNGDRIVMPMVDHPVMLHVSAGGALVQMWQERSSTVESVAGVSELRFSVHPDGAMDTIPTAMITANFLTTVGERPILGRGFSIEDERSGNAVAMISHALWQREYGGSTEVIGGTVHHESVPFTIVGVMPASLTIPLSRNPVPDVWLPAPLERTGSGAGDVGGPGIFVTLRPGVTVEAAEQELAAVVAGLSDSAPSWQNQGGVRLMRAQDFIDSRAVRTVRILFAAVGALLLIACANVANLLLARSWTRRREFAVRGALGGGRGRLARQVLTESMLLAFTGGLVGVGLAWIGLRVIVALRPPALDQLYGVGLDPTVLLWAVGVSIGTALLFGSAPALFAARPQLGEVLRRESRGASAGPASSRVRSALIVFQIAVSLMLLVGAGLLVRSSIALQQMPLGFEPRGLLFLDIMFGRNGPENRDQRPVIRDAIVRNLRAIPGVAGVAIGTMPGKPFVMAGGVEVEAGSDGHTTSLPEFGIVFVTPEYLSVAGIGLASGRLPDSTVARTGPLFGMSPEVLVNSEFARRVWADDGEAIGARLRGGPDGFPPGVPPQPWSTIVGVVADTRMPDVRGDIADLQVYSLVPPALGNLGFMVRSTTSADIAAPIVKQAAVSTDPTVYVRRMISGDTYLRDGLAPTRFATTLLSTFALVALILAAVGLYGVIAYSVAQRTREIGVRVALGAKPGAIVARLVAGGVSLAVIGVVLGAALAVGASRVLESILYGVSPLDPVSFVGTAILVSATAVVASYIPARRALRIDPVEALRAD